MYKPIRCPKCGKAETVLVSTEHGIEQCPKCGRTSPVEPWRLTKDYKVGVRYVRVGRKDKNGDE